jgi:hypothetical protein
MYMYTYGFTALTALVEQVRKLTIMVFNYNNRDCLQSARVHQFAVSSNIVIKKLHL